MKLAQDTYRLLHGLTKGEVIKVGKAKFVLNNNRYSPEFQKVGTSGTKYYGVEYFPDGSIAMFQVGGSGQRISDNVVEGLVEVYK